MSLGAGARPPIDHDWIKRYVDQMLEVAAKLADGPMKDALLHRVDAILDMVDAWRKRDD